MSALRYLHRIALLLVLTCIARGAPHDFATGAGTSPGGPGNPNKGQPPCHNGSSTNPDASPDSDPVDIFRGELILDRRDLFLPGRGLGVEVTFHYRSQSVENGQFGYGWTFNYSRRIRKLDNGNAVLLQGTNRVVEYAPTRLRSAASCSATRWASSPTLTSTATPATTRWTLRILWVSIGSSTPPTSRPEWGTRSPSV